MLNKENIKIYFILIFIFFTHLTSDGADRSSSTIKHWKSLSSHSRKRFACRGIIEFFKRHSLSADSRKKILSLLNGTQKSVDDLGVDQIDRLVMMARILNSLKPGDLEPTIKYFFEDPKRKKVLKKLLEMNFFEFYNAYSSIALHPDNYSEIFRLINETEPDERVVLKRLETTDDSVKSVINLIKINLDNDFHKLITHLSKGDIFFDHMNRKSWILKGGIHSYSAMTSFLKKSLETLWGTEFITKYGKLIEQIKQQIENPTQPATEDEIFAYNSARVAKKYYKGDPELSVLAALPNEFIFKRPKLEDNGVIKFQLSERLFNKDAWKNSIRLGLTGSEPPGAKTLFPTDWTDDKIKKAIIHILSDKKSIISLSADTNALKKATKIEGEFEGVRISIGTYDGHIITAYPSWDQEFSILSAKEIESKKIELVTEIQRETEKIEETLEWLKYKKINIFGFEWNTFRLPFVLYKRIFLSTEEELRSTKIPAILKTINAVGYPYKLDRFEHSLEDRIALLGRDIQHTLLEYYGILKKEQISKLPP